MRFRPCIDIHNGDLTGEDFNPDYYVNYLKNKYKEIYQL